MKKFIVDQKLKIDESIEESKKPKYNRSFYRKLKAMHEDYIDDARKTMKEDSLMLYPLKRFKSLENDTMALKYLVVYSINNPLLNNAKQEISKTMLFSRNKDKVIGNL